MARTGKPLDWELRRQVSLGIALPEGAVFYETPGHGFLRVDVRRFPDITVGAYDYFDGTDHVLLEEDCSLPIGLAEMGLIPWEDAEPYIGEKLRGSRVRATASKMAQAIYINSGQISAGG